MAFDLVEGTDERYGFSNESPEDLNRRLFDTYQSSRANWITQAKEDEDFAKGAQWTSAEITWLSGREASSRNAYSLVESSDATSSLVYFILFLSYRSQHLC